MEKESAETKDAGARLPLSAVPKRKPVPLSGRDPSPPRTQFPAPVGKNWFAKQGFTFPLPRRCLNWDKRTRRKYIISIVVGVVVLLALIIGLAAGLTSRNKVANLPLPTGNGGPYTGDLTYYEPALGSCGKSSSGSDNICAVSKALYDAVSSGSDPNQNSVCGMKIRLRRGNRSVDVEVVDRCVACAPKDIDVTQGVFEKLASVDQGRVQVHWAWLQKAPFDTV